MTDSLSLHAAEAAAVLDAQPDRPDGGNPRSRRANAMRDALMRSLVPVLLALVVGGVLLLVLGEDPFTFYGNIWQYGIAHGSWEDSAMRAAPLLLIAVGLIAVFRANIWNLGYDGQFLIGAALITGVAPHLQSLPNSLSLLILFALAMTAGAAWTIIPALLKARYQTNEIITTLMMSFIGIGMANILIKGPFQDPTVRIPETRVIPFDHMLPSIPGTRIHAGVLVALGVALLAHYVLTRTSFGLRLRQGGKVLAFSGDTAYVAALQTIAAGADLFICECYSGAPKMSNHIDWPLLRGKLPLLKAKRIALTHLGETALPMAGEMRAAGVTPAQDGMVVEL